MGRRVSRIYLSLLAAAGLASCAAHAGDWDLVDAWLGQAEDLARSLEMRASELDQTVRPGMEAAQIAGQQARLARMVALMALVETPAEGDP